MQELCWRVPAESRLDSINGEGRVGETSGSRRWRLYNDMRRVNTICLTVGLDKKKKTKKNGTLVT